MNASDRNELLAALAFYGFCLYVFGCVLYGLADAGSYWWFALYYVFSIAFAILTPIHFIREMRRERKNR